MFSRTEDATARGADAESTSKVMFKGSAPRSLTYLYTWNGNALMYANTLCCLANLAVTGTNSGGCGCGSKMSRFEKGMLMLEAAKYAMNCNNTNAAAKALLAANELCNGCKDC